MFSSSLLHEPDSWLNLGDSFTLQRRCLLFAPVWCVLLGFMEMLAVDQLSRNTHKCSFVRFYSKGGLNSQLKFETHTSLYTLSALPDRLFIPPFKTTSKTLSRHLRPPSILSSPGPGPVREPSARDLYSSGELIMASLLQKLNLFDNSVMACAHRVCFGKESERGGAKSRSVFSLGSGWVKRVSVRSEQTCNWFWGTSLFHPPHTAPPSVATHRMLFKGFVSAQTKSHLLANSFSL